METFEVVRERFAAVYTAALTDILDKRGYRRQTLPHELRPLVPGTRIAGPAFTVLGRPADQPDHDASIRKVLAMLGSIPAEHIAVYSCNQDLAAHLGELSVTSLKARGVVGVVLDGGCRDVRFIIEEGFPVFSRHVTPEDCIWRWDLTATNVPITVGRVAIQPGDWIVADEDGVVAIPAAIVEDVLADAEQKVATESAIRRAVRRGVPPLAAYEEFGSF
jgi:4-hydroxy-4-methyl-2-oxoglutarate aldolase